MIILNERGTQSDYVKSADDVNKLWGNYIPQEKKSLLDVKKVKYRGADKSLARLGRKKATATEDFDFHIPSF